MRVNVYTEQEVTLVKHFSIDVVAKEVIDHFALRDDENWQDHIKEYVDNRLSEMTKNVDQHYVKTIAQSESVHEVIYEQC